MRIDDTSLFAEVMKINNEGSKPVHHFCNLVFWIPSLSKTIKPTKLLEIDWVDDHELTYAPTITARLVIPAGDYAFDLYPYQKELEAKLSWIPIGEDTNAAVVSKPIELEHYYVVFQNPEKYGDLTVKTMGNNPTTRSNLNLSALIDDFTVQLIPKSVMAMSKQQIGGVINNTTAGELLVTLLTEFTKKSQIESKITFNGVNMVTPDNKSAFRQVVIPQNTKLVDLPHFIQKTIGVYSSGMGYYYYHNEWWLYPCYSTDFQQQKGKRLSVIVMPEARLAGIRRTYRETGDSAVILVTGQIDMVDNTNKMQMTAGTGVRFADANALINRQYATDGKISRKDNVTEINSVNRAKGINASPVADKMLTTTPYNHYSNLSKMDCTAINLVWHNSNPDILHPGITAKVMYYSEGKVKELQGVLLKAHHYYSAEGKGITLTRHVCISALTFLVRRDI
jgi:hypothetical protein